MAKALTRTHKRHGRDAATDDNRVEPPSGLRETVCLADEAGDVRQVVHADGAADDCRDRREEPEATVGTCEDRRPGNDRRAHESDLAVASRAGNAQQAAKSRHPRSDRTDRHHDSTKQCDRDARVDAAVQCASRRNRRGNRRGLSVLTHTRPIQVRPRRHRFRLIGAAVVDPKACRRT